MVVCLPVSAFSGIFSLSTLQQYGGLSRMFLTPCPTVPRIASSPTTMSLHYHRRNATQMCCAVKRKTQQLPQYLEAERRANLHCLYRGFIDTSLVSQQLYIIKSQLEELIRAKYMKSGKEMWGFKDYYYRASFKWHSWEQIGYFY